MFRSVAQGIHTFVMYTKFWHLTVLPVGLKDALTQCFSLFYYGYSCIHHKSVGVHVPFCCMIKRELYCFMSQNVLWQLYLLINLLKLASWVCGKRFKSCISSIWISSWWDVRYFCCRQLTHNLKCYLPMFGAVCHLKLSEE